MKLLVAGSIIALMANSVFAKEELRSPEVLFAKKCAMCHTIGKPKNKEARKHMVAPPVDVAMSGVVITIDALEGPMSDAELRKASIEFLKDYFFNPTEDKTNCEDQVVKNFGRMPSLKGFVKPEELDVLVPWVYDKFKPVKVNGKYQKHH